MLPGARTILELRAWLRETLYATIMTFLRGLMGPN